MRERQGKRLKRGAGDFVRLFGFSPAGCGHSLKLRPDVALLHHQMAAADSLPPAVDHGLTPGTEAALR